MPVKPRGPIEPVPDHCPGCMCGEANLRRR